MTSIIAKLTHSILCNFAVIAYSNSTLTVKLFKYFCLSFYFYYLKYIKNNLGHFWQAVLLQSMVKLLFLASLQHGFPQSPKAVSLIVWKIWLCT